MRSQTPSQAPLGDERFKVQLRELHHIRKAEDADLAGWGLSIAQETDQNYNTPDSH